jgi:excisionase family DNA binding protein
MTRHPVSFDVATLAKHWSVSTTFVYDLIAAGELPAWRLGGKLWRIHPDAVGAYECRQATALSRSLDDARTGPPIAHGKLNGLMAADRTASRLARMTARPQRLALVHSGPRET